MNFRVEMCERRWYLATIIEQREKVENWALGDKLCMLQEHAWHVAFGEESGLKFAVFILRILLWKIYLSDALSAVPSDQRLSSHETVELICTIRCWTLCFVDACKEKKSQLNLICGNAARWTNPPWGWGKRILGRGEGNPSACKTGSHDAK